jgi:hypothetical protein
MKATENEVGKSNQATKAYNFFFDSALSRGFENTPQHAEDQSPGPVLTLNDVALTAGAGYRLTQEFGLGLSFQYINSSGLEDPTASSSWNYKFEKTGWTWINSTSLSAPVSKQSQLDNRITTWSLTSGADFRQGRWVVRTAALTAVPSYSNQNSSAPTARKEVPGSGINPNSVVPDEHGAEHHEDEAWIERSRFGGTIRSFYKITRMVRIATGYDVARIERYAGPSTFASEFTVAKLTYSESNYEMGLSVSLKDEHQSFAAPTHPASLFNIGFSI